MSKYLVLDSNAVCHKVKHSLGELNNDTMRVGVIFGFFLQILKYAKDHECNQFAFAWDSKKSHREKLFPAYKEKRRSKDEKTPEEIEEDKLAYAQFDLLRDEFLPAVGFQNIFHAEGYEGDDILASLVDNSNPSDKLVLVTGDEDIYQLLCPGVSILKRKQNERKKWVDILYTDKDFIAEYGITPDKWSLVKAIAGCSTDEVPGIKGIGEKRAIQYLNGELNPTKSAYKDIHSPEGKKIIARNKPLVTLPFKDCPEFYLKKDYRLSLDGFMDMCNRLSFNFFLKKENLSQWKGIMNMR